MLKELCGNSQQMNRRINMDKTTIIWNDYVTSILGLVASVIVVIEVFEVIDEYIYRTTHLTLFQL